MINAPFRVCITRVTVLLLAGIASLQAQENATAQRKAESCCLSPQVFIDGKAAKGLCNLQPDAILWVEISPAGDTVQLFTTSAVTLGERWLSWQQAAKQKGVKNYYIDWQPVDQKEFQQLTADQVKSIEYNAAHKELSLFTRAHKGFVIARNGIADAFLYQPTGAASDNDAADSAAYRIAYAASFVPAKFHGGDIDAFTCQVAAQAVYPPALQRFNRNGVGRIRFEVRADGTLGKIENANSTNQIFADELIRIVNETPRYTPAYAFGQPVASSYLLTLHFNIPAANMSLTGRASPPGMAAR